MPGLRRFWRGRRLLELLPPNGAESWTGIALLVIRGADLHLIAFLLQSAYVCLVRPGSLDALTGYALRP